MLGIHTFHIGIRDAIWPNFKSLRNSSCIIHSHLKIPISVESITVASSISSTDIEIHPISTTYTYTPIMTTFVQHPKDATLDVPHYAMQESRTQHVMPVNGGQQQMLGHQHPASLVQPYPDQEPQYHQSGYNERSVQVPTQNAQPRYLEVISYGPSTTGYDQGQQLRPALDQRLSESSFRSARSHKSTGSTNSHRSHHSHHSTKSAHSHRSHHSHHSHHGVHDEFRSRKKRDIDARPTMGDSVMLVVDHFRDLLSGDRH